MRKLMTGVAFAAAMVVCGGSALAVDQTLVGKKLIILNPLSGPANNKVVYLSKDTTIATPLGATEDPRCPAAGSDSAQLTVGSVTSGESFTIGLPCGNWTVNGAGNTYRYKDTTGATCKIVIVKAGRLNKAVCKGTQVNYDLTNVDQVKVDVVLRAGSAPRRWCASFSALPNGCDVVKNGSDGKKYLAKNCTTASGCGASPSGAFLDAASLF
jgi:fructose-specific component phosphotransferase system IIB-like protein